MEQIAKLLDAVAAIAWVALAGWLVYILRDTFPSMLSRMSGLEVAGIKISISAEALRNAVAMARKNPAWDAVVPDAEAALVLDRAHRERALLDGAEILWVDDRPANNRNEARMLAALGVYVTFASSTDEALDCVALAQEQARPFNLVISDINRDFPEPDRTAGLTMLAEFAERWPGLPVIFYVGRSRQEAPAPGGAFGLTARPDVLLHLVLDAVARDPARSADRRRDPPIP